MTLWQTWLIIGILLMIGEVVTPGFVLFFFGIAALLLSLLTALLPGLNPYLQAILFSLFSFGSIFFCRRALKNIFKGKTLGTNGTLPSEFIGKTATVIERITPARPGKVEFNGANWKAKSDEILEPHATVTITAQENLTLTVAEKS